MTQNFQPSKTSKKCYKTCHRAEGLGVLTVFNFQKIDVL